MTSDRPPAAWPEERGPFYCARCGTVTDSPARFCPACGAALPGTGSGEVAELANVLTALRRLHADGALADDQYVALRGRYEEELGRARVAGGATAARTGAAIERKSSETAAVERGSLLGRLLDGERAGREAAPLPPRRPPKPPGPTLGEWAAARQADLILYLGAFLLAIASFIFLQAQGDTVSGVVRFLVLVAYTAGCLALGVLLPRWERVREAGPVFLALGALLVPVDFVALRVQVLGAAALPDDALWLVGGGVTAALYLLLAARGYGRWYAVTGALAAVIAWFAFFFVLNPPEEWLGVWALLGAALVTGGAAWVRPRFADALCWGAAALGGLGLLLATGIGANEPGYQVQFPLAALLALGIAVLSVWAWRWTAAKGALPPLGAYALLACWWFVAGFSAEWAGAYLALAGLGYLALAHLDGDPRARWWAAVAAGWGALGLVVAHLTAADEYAEVMRGALPATYALVLAGAGAAAWRWRWWQAFLALPALGALLGVTALWALDVEPVWWAYPGLAAVALVLAAERWWRTRPVLSLAGWPYALGGALVLLLLFLPLHVERPGHGLTVSAVVAGVFLWAALQTRGALMRLLGIASEPAPGWERLTLARASGLLLYVAAAYFNGWAGLTGTDRAWVYLGIGMAAWAGLVLAGRMRREVFGILAPGGVLALVLAASIAGPDADRTVLVLALATLGPVAAFPATRRWPLWCIAAAFGLAAMVALWRWQGWAWPLLPLAWAALAAALSAALTPLRRYGWGERPVSVALLSWGPWLAAVASAWMMVQARSAEFPRPVSLARTDEWLALTAAVAAAAVAVTVEGLRLRTRWVAVPGTMGLLVAALLAIAITEPENVQAYTLPAGLYFIGLGLTYRRSPELFGPHLLGHETAHILGLALLLLPPAEQSFAPDGGWFGLEVIGLGLALLVAGLVLAARWLVAGGVAALSAVAVRWLFTSGAVPYWLTLGLVGMALLGAGLLLLLNREWWDSARRRVARWWLEAPGGPDPSGSGA